MAKAFSATETGPFSASHAAISEKKKERQKLKKSKFNSSLVPSATQQSFLVTRDQNQHPLIFVIILSLK